MRVRAFDPLTLCTLALIVIVAAAPPPAWAQQHNPPAPATAPSSPTSSAGTAVPSISETVVVTASATPVTERETGAPVTVLDSRTLDVLNQPGVFDALRLVPGVHVDQTGGRGGPTSLFIRGGNANFNKVLIDDVPVNDIGGGFDFGQLATTGVGRVEVLRQTNSVMYGSDALAGVVSIATRRGTTRTPEATFAADAGNLGTATATAGLGGLVRRVDYFSEYSHQDTSNDVPNNAYRNDSYAGRFGAAVGGGTGIDAAVRHSDASYGAPNAFDLYGIADDASQKNAFTSAALSARSQWTNRWQSVLRFGAVDQTVRFVNPSPTGEPYDPFGFGANYLGRTVTLRGADGATVTGRGILDFGGTYPSRFASRMTRRILSGETSYMAGSVLTIAGGARVERESGFSDPDGAADLTRHNGGAFVEGRVSLMARHYITAGVGVEHNAVFGEAATPRLSVASYLRRPAARGGSDTRLVLNAGTGIKAPTVFEQQSSLYSLLKGTDAGSGVAAIAPERSRSFDVGIEQGLPGTIGRVRVSYFHNRFSDLIEFLSKTTLPRVGVPAAVAEATAFGAYVNSQSYVAQGLESAVDLMPRRDLRVSASYTRLDAEVTQAFSASASFNPAFPGVAIGAFSPLVGERPFRRPANSGTVMVMYTPSRAELALTASFVGKRDDSTFLTDPLFGNSLLLPNRDLDPAYQKVDVSGSFPVHPRVRAYVVVENVLDRQYEVSFGYPALPITARVGVRVRLGGEPTR